MELNTIKQKKTDKQIVGAMRNEWKDFHNFHKIEKQRKKFKE